MKRNVLISILFITAISLIVSGVIFFLQNPISSDKSKKEVEYNTKIKKETKYNDLNIKNIVLKKEKQQVILEMTLENVGQQRFYEKETELIFRKDKKKIGIELIELPTIEPNDTQNVSLKISDSKFFSATDFSLRTKIVVEKDEPSGTG